MSEGEGCLGALLRGAGLTRKGLRGVIAVAGHLAGGGGVLWRQDEKCGTLGACFPSYLPVQVTLNSFLLNRTLFNPLHRPSKLKFHLHDLANMTSRTHLIRFIAVEDHAIHLGQLVDTSRDIGLGSLHNIEIRASLIHGIMLAMSSQSTFSQSDKSVTPFPKHKITTDQLCSCWPPLPRRTVITFGA